MAAHHGHDEHHQRPLVHTKQHGSQEQRWRRHIQHGRHVERMDGPRGPVTDFTVQAQMADVQEPGGPTRPRLAKPNT